MTRAAGAGSSVPGNSVEWWSAMRVSLRQIRSGAWAEGWVLDKHVVSSTYVGDSAQGRPQFNTVRTDVGEATYQLKYRQDWTQVEPLARALASHIYPKFDWVDLIIPMPPTTPPPTPACHRGCSGTGQDCGLARTH